MPSPPLVDLHIHTTASDGSDTPREVVQKAHAKKLAAIAITDHDTLSGLEEAEEEGQRLGVGIIRGCEISVSSEYGEMHLLGLWIPKSPTELLASLKELRNKRRDRNQAMIDRLQGLGIDISLNEVLAFGKGESIGRPHIAQVLIEKGVVPSTKEAFHKYLGATGLAYEPKACMTAEEGMHSLKNIDATISLAHCMLIKCPQTWLDSTIDYLKSLGLSAIEAYHAEHNAKDERICVDMAARHGLGLTGGSDYHGLSKPNIQIGRGKGNLRVTLALLDQLKMQRRAQGLPV